jgi:hypothetical protein
VNKLIDIDVVTYWIREIGIILGVLFATYKLIDKYLIKRFAKIEKNLVEQGEGMKSLRSWVHKQQIDISENAVRWKIVIDSLLSCLHGLKQTGANGSVERGIRVIEEYISERAYKTESKLHYHNSSKLPLK